MAPEPMDSYEKMALRAAASRAMQVLPPCIARLISRDLLDWEDFGYRFGNKEGIAGAVAEINKLDRFHDEVKNREQWSSD